MLGTQGCGHQGRRHRRLKARRGPGTRMCRRAPASSMSGGSPSPPRRCAPVG
jgi:hypothetical protein